MPHIHNQPGQHDATVSAYIILNEDGQWKCIVHYHKKMDILMQIGGHVELTENPWQTAAHEVREESGYSLEELTLLQFTADQPEENGNIMHPQAFASDTHNIGNDHFHSDLCYGFIANTRPKQEAAEGESNDIRWLTLEEMETGVKSGEVLLDVTYIYRFLLKHIDNFVKVPATKFSLEYSVNNGVTYKRGAPGQKDGK